MDNMLGELSMARRWWCDLLIVCKINVFYSKSEVDKYRFYLGEPQMVQMSQSSSDFP